VYSLASEIAGVGCCPLQDSSDSVRKCSMVLNLQVFKYDQGMNKLHFWSFTAPVLDNHS